MMKKVLYAALVGSLVCAAGANAQTTVTLELVSDTSDEYRIEATITGGDASEGLALWGADVDFGVTGPPAPMSTPPAMSSFGVNAGLNNPPPGGYGGTLSGNILLQVGGAQNTINNDPGNAPYPIGAVVTGIGSTTITVAVGTCFAGADYMTLENCFANVINEGETGPLHATSPADVTCIGTAVSCGSSPACCLFDGTCIETNTVDCLAQGGWPQGPGSACLGDGNGNGIDDTCEDEPCEDGGPGPHWVDNTPAGLDQVPSGALVGIDTDLDCIADTSLVLFGPVTITRTDPLDDSANFPGLRQIDEHLDVIDTEMIFMSLSGGGISLTAGAGQGQGSVLSNTFGAIAEDPTDPLSADSFFDVFFEVDVGSGQYLYNHSALQVNVPGRIGCVPPDASYIHPTGCLELYTDPTGGVHVANLVSADHDLFPAPGDGDFDDDGDVDLMDFAAFQRCFACPGMTSECRAGDFEPDGDVDPDDYADFVPVFTGP